MDIKKTPTFERHYDERANSRIKALFRKKVRVFVKKPHDTSLNLHALKYEWAGHFSFSLTDDQGPDDYRVILKKTKVAYRFVDFGTHNQLYRPWR